MSFVRRILGMAPPTTRAGGAGWDSIPIAEFDALLLETIEPPLLAAGFETSGKRRWVRSSSAPVRDVVQVVAMKGLTYGVMWGHSLDYAPRLVKGEVRWHRTARSADIDVPFPGFGPPWRIPLWKGDQPERLVREFGAQVEPDLLQWLEVPEGERSLLPKFEAATAELTWYGYWVNVAFAATLVRLGERARAAEQFDMYASQAQEAPDAVEALRRAALG